MRSPEENALFNTIYEPTSDEFAGMAVELQAYYTEDELALLTESTAAWWRRFACGKSDPGRLVKRVIWLLYMAHKHPDKLVGNKLSLFTWGKNCGELPKFNKLTLSDKRRLAGTFVAHLKQRGINYSVEEIAALCGVPLVLAREACDANNYHPSTHDPVDLYAPGSIWYRMDWRKSDERLARDHQLAYGAVALARKRLAEMPAAIAATNIYRTNGSNFDWFWCLWSHAKQIEVYHAALECSAKDEKGRVTNVFVDSQ